MPKSCPRYWEAPETGLFCSLSRSSRAKLLPNFCPRSPGHAFSCSDRKSGIGESSPAPLSVLSGCGWGSANRRPEHLPRPDSGLRD
jgi:hypothetical protein